jgi:hypothetical protein
MMRKLLREQVQMGEYDIASVEIELDTRDEIPQLLRGLQHIYATTGLRKRVFEVLWEIMPADVDIDRGRNGMDLWKILVLGTLRVCCNCDYDHLQELANNHVTLRRMLGHGLLEMDVRYSRQTLNDNLRLFTPEALDKINRIVVDAGHDALRIPTSAPLHGRCDSFVVETDVHFPTDINLLWDATRKVVVLTHRMCEEAQIAGWRQASYLLRSVKRKFRTVQRLRERNDHRRECLAATRVYVDHVKALLDRAMDTIKDHRITTVSAMTRAFEIRRFADHGNMLIDQIERRCFRDEKIPHEEKLFSLFEEHTEWITKGKAGVAQELGLKVCILECASGFILHHRVMQQETDDQIAIPMVKEAKSRYPMLESCSFDKGFHSPDNQEQLAKMLSMVVLPRKGKLGGEQSRLEKGRAFVMLRRKHAAVESGINALECHGLDRVYDYGLDAFERYVALSVVGRNIQLLGRKLQDAEQERLRKKRERLRAAA